MRLKKTGNMIEPFDEFDQELFSHITHGSESITDKRLYELKDVFTAHSVYAVEINGEVVEL